MALELSVVPAPPKPRTEYDDAYDYLKESDTGWAAAAVAEGDVRKTKRGLSQAAKVDGRSIKYEESAVDPRTGKVTLTFTLKPYVSPEEKAEKKAQAEARKAAKAAKAAQ